MKKAYRNRCYRCGKERIVTKTWKEGMGTAKVTITQTACPDPECQKTVNRELKKQKEKTKLMTKKKEERLLARKSWRRTKINHPAAAAM